MPAPIDYNALPDDAFRQELREWIEANYPEDKRSPPRRLLYAEIEDWFQALSKKGWLAPNWPVEHGGMGLAPSKYVIYVEEMERHGCARLPDHAIQMVGPLLIKYGAERQKVHFLPRILAGEDIWCQGYSEPNAGSDLASIRTEAVKDGDDYIVNGQKIWTTLAHSANWIFMLVRTDKTASRPQKGISFLLASLETPGVTVRPITNLKGDQDFCEVFFDDVRVPMENLVGVENEGWTMAKALLGFERIFLGTPRLPGYSLNRLQLLCEKLGAFDDPSVLDQFTQHRLDVRDLTSAFEGYIDHIRKDGAVGPDVSFMKIWATEVNQQ
ncbi:MAG: acyl-CoA dehydrogenase family protein, partial [Alphaproteobacteria bacterium]